MAKSGGEEGEDEEAWRVARSENHRSTERSSAVAKRNSAVAKNAKLIYTGDRCRWIIGSLPFARSTHTSSVSQNGFIERQIPLSRRDDTVGMYRLTRQIARGNATFIWEAIKLGTTDRFVVKVLDEKNRGVKEEVACLKLEYDVAHQLSHPNVIRVFEVNTGNPAFIVLEVFSVMNLKQGVRQERDRILYEFHRIADQCAAGLGHLHSKGWVHCDVKPDNFLWNDKGDIKLIDFTIARKAASGFLGRMFGSQKVIRGTRSYMSPEQIRGKPVDTKSDIYSYGCLLYELLSGKLPFTANSPNELLTKHLSAPVPNVQVQNDNVTPEMGELLRKLMSKEPKSRPSTMADVQKLIKSIRVFRSAPKPPKPSTAEGDAASAKH